MSKIKSGSRRQKEILIKRADNKKKNSVSSDNQKQRLRRRKQMAKTTAELKELGKNVNLEALRRRIVK